MKRIPPEFLSDLAILVKRHPSADWVKLAHMLEDDNTRSKIVSFLLSFSELRDDIFSASTPEPVAHQKSSSRPSDESDRMKLTLGRASPSTLRELAASVGVRVSPKDSRKRLIVRLLRSRKLAPTIIEKKISSYGSSGRTNDYGQWASIILGKGDKRR